jgi:hypothetical protein
VDPGPVRGTDVRPDATHLAGGRSTNVLAEELGGPDVVSANVHRTSTADHLRPCEMAEAKVLDFLRGWQPA